MTQAPIMLAVDVPTPDEARAWIKRMAGVVPVFKIGMQVYYAAVQLWRKATLGRSGGQLFLELKLR